MADYLKMAREWEKARRNKIDDKVMLSLFSQATNELDKIYIPGAFRWLEENRPDLDQEITTKGRTLNRIWLQAREGKATLADFTKALEGYKRAIRKGMVGYQISGGRE